MTYTKRGIFFIGTWIAVTGFTLLFLSLTPILPISILSVFLFVITIQIYKERLNVRIIATLSSIIAAIYCVITYVGIIWLKYPTSSIFSNEGPPIYRLLVLLFTILNASAFTATAMGLLKSYRSNVIGILIIILNTLLFLKVPYLIYFAY